MFGLTNSQFLLFSVSTYNERTEYLSLSTGRARLGVWFSSPTIIWTPAISTELSREQRDPANSRFYRLTTAGITTTSTIIILWYCTMHYGINIGNIDYLRWHITVSLYRLLDLDFIEYFTDKYGHLIASFQYGSLSFCSATCSIES